MAQDWFDQATTPVQRSAAPRGPITIGRPDPTIANDERRKESADARAEAAEGRAARAEDRANRAEARTQDALTARGGVDSTEGERKAATLATRVAAGIAKLDTLDSAVAPTLLEGTVGNTRIGNYAVSEERQRIRDAQLDILDAALTLGTGAAYTKEQLEGYRQSYFPQPGDQSGTISDKQERLRVILEAARLSAGAASPQIDAALSRSKLFADTQQPPAASPPPTGSGDEAAAQYSPDGTLRVPISSNAPPPPAPAGPVESPFSSMGDSLSGAFDAVDAATRGIGDAASFGFMDELGAGLYAPFGATIDALKGNGFGLGTAYNRALDRGRQQAAEDEKNSPTARIIGQLLGGGVAGTALAPLSASARVSQALAPRIAAGTADGGIAGALYGAGSGESAGERGWEAAKMGLIGAAGGAALSAIGAGASGAYSAFRNTNRAAPIAREIGVDPETLRIVGNIMNADGSLGPAGQSRMSQAGREAMLVDAGPTAQSILDTAIQRGGPGAIVARQRVDDRVARDAAALTGALDDVLGQPQGVTAARSAIREGTSGARQSAYDAAYAQPIDYASEQGMALEALIRNRVPQSAIDRANALMRTEGNPSRQMMARVGEDGSVSYEVMPDVRQIDYLTRALNDVAQAGEGAGAMGGINALGRAYQGLSGDIRSTLRNLVPEYGTALETAADPIRRSQAVELGSKLLSPSMTRDRIAEALMGYTGPESQALRQGLRSQIDDSMARVTRTVADDDVMAREAIKGLRDLSSRANREKVATAIGEDDAGRLFNELDRAAQSFNLRSTLTGNSRTYGRQAAQERVRDFTQPGVAGSVMRGEPVNAGKRITQALTGYTDEAIRGREDEVFAEIADILTRQGGAGPDVYSAVRRMDEVDVETQAVADRIARALMGPSASYPLAIQWQGR